MNKFTMLMKEYNPDFYMKNFKRHKFIGTAIYKYMYNEVVGNNSDGNFDSRRYIPLNNCITARRYSPLS